VARLARFLAALGISLGRLRIETELSSSALDRRFESSVLHEFEFLIASGARSGVTGKPVKSRRGPATVSGMPPCAGATQVLSNLGKVGRRRRGFDYPLKPRVRRPTRGDRTQNSAWKRRVRWLRRFPIVTLVRSFPSGTRVFNAFRWC